MGVYTQQRRLGQSEFPQFPAPSSGGADPISSLINLLFGKDWTKIRDTQKIEELNRLLAPIWALATYTTTGQMDCHFAQQMGVPCPEPVSLSAAQASQLISAVQQANQQVMSSYERPESRQNATHTIVVPNLLSMLQQIAGGARAPGVTSPAGGSTPLTPGGFDLSSMLPWLLAGVGAVMLLRSS